MSQRHASPRRAIQDALSRLGMQARPAQVVAVLAERGIRVSEERVRAVVFELLRAGARAEVQKNRFRPLVVTQPVRRFARVSPRRDRRR